MTNVLCANDCVWVEAFSGLSMRQFRKLVALVRRRGGDHGVLGRPWIHGLSDRVLMVATYYRTNLTMRQVGPLFGVCPATVHRAVRDLGPLLGIEPVKRRKLDAPDRIWIVDGTLVPVRDRVLAASSKNYRFSANVQILIDADTRLVVSVGRPAPGNRNDAQVFGPSGIADDIDLARVAVVLADGAYAGTGCVVPHRKRKNKPLLAIEETDNRVHRKVRARVEHAIARLKHWKILRDCRLKGPGLLHATRAIAHMHNLAYAN